MKKYIEALQNISYPEWVKLRTAIDKNFDMQKKELEKDIQLSADSDELHRIIHSQFG